MCAKTTPVAGASRGGTESILVVEDDDMVRSFVVVLLCRLGYTVRYAASGAEALEVLDGEGTFDLLFTDIVMVGGMDGLQLAEAALIRQPGLKVLYTSGYLDETILHQGRLDAGSNLIGKPYRREDLAAKIRLVLEGKAWCG